MEKSKVRWQLTEGYRPDISFLIREKYREVDNLMNVYYFYYYHYYYYYYPRLFSLPWCRTATQAQSLQWRRENSPWRRWRSSPRLVSPRWTITTLRRSARWSHGNPSKFLQLKKTCFLKQIRSLLLDYYWSWMSSDSSWKILFYHHIWDWPQKWLKISCLVRDFYISRPQRESRHWAQVT